MKLGSVENGDRLFVMIRYMDMLTSDVLDRRGGVIQKTELKNTDYKKALDIADEDIEANWKTYKKDFLR